MSATPAHDHQNEKALRQYRNQVRSLRHSIDEINEEHTREITALKTEHTVRVKEVRVEGLSEIQRLRKSLDEARSALESEETARKEYEKQCNSLIEENIALRKKIDELNQEVDLFKTPEKKEDEKKGHKFKVEDIEKEHAATVKCLELTISNREEDLNSLEKQLSALRKDLDETRSASNNEKLQLKQELKSIKDSLENEKAENMKLRSSKDELEDSKRDLVSESKKMSFELSSTKSENKLLAQKIERLNKIVFTTN